MAQPLNPSQRVDHLKTSSDHIPEVSQIMCVADTGVLNVTSITTVADVAGSLNSKYFTFKTAADAHKYYVWFNINSAGVDPAVAGHTGISVAGATNVSASTLGGAIRTAISGSAAAAFVTVTGSTSSVVITNKASGTSTAAADGTAATGFTITTSTAGVASNLNSKYFSFQDAIGDTYYAWFNVHSEGVDPAPASQTGIVVALSLSDTAATVASLLAAAVDAQASFLAVSDGAMVQITNATYGSAVDIVDGDSGLTLATHLQGQSGRYRAAQSPESINNNPVAF